MKRKVLLFIALTFGLGACSASIAPQNNAATIEEDVIDFDLLEDLVCYIDENYPPGAILVFLPVSLKFKFFLLF